MENWTWIYLLFFLIPLARILPRILRRSRLKSMNHVDNSTNYRPGFSNNYTEQPQQYVSTNDPTASQKKPESKEMMVLGAINNGAKTFDKIRKETQIEHNELNDILENLEKKELMRVERKSGLFGTKVELYVTDKGFSEYHS